MPGEIKTTIEQTVKDTGTQIVLEAMLARKIGEAGIPVDKKLIRKLAEHFKDGKKNPFKFPKKYKAITGINFAIFDEDQAFLETIYQNIERDQGAIIEDLVEDAHQSILQKLLADWPVQHKWEKAVTRQFRKNLEARWGKGFDRLRMMLTISREIGAAKVNALQATGRHPGAKHDVLVRLHIRSCQIVSEIIALMEDGYADGAIARWRTLYEVETVAALIFKHDEELAERYLAHEIVESKKASDMYATDHVALGFEPFPPETLAKIQGDFEAVVAKYGPEFKESYGWAAKLTGKKSPNFFNLLDLAGEPHMKSYYKFASHNVHAGTKGIGFKLGALQGRPVQLAGASNAGFEEPVQNTASSLARVTSFLFGETWDLDFIVYWRVLSDLRDQAIKAAIKAGKKLKRDDEKVRAALDARQQR